MLRLALIGLAVAPLVAGPAVAATGRSAPAEVVREPVAQRCPMINIGTPERPRLVKDPACDRGTG